jgi:carbon storage regulator CsrA
MFRIGGRYVIRAAVDSFWYIIKEGGDMLVLSRKVGEQIIIDNHIVVEVTHIGPTSIKLGTTAPRGTPIDRGEIHERKQLALSATGEDA